MAPCTFRQSDKGFNLMAPRMFCVWKEEAEGGAVFFQAAPPKHSWSDARYLSDGIGV